MLKPKGKYKCVICDKEWDGSELYEELRTGRWTCGDLFCGANVVKIEDKK